MTTVFRKEGVSGLFMCLMFVWMWNLNMNEWHKIEPFPDHQKFQILFQNLREFWRLDLDVAESFIRCGKGKTHPHTYSTDLGNTLCFCQKQLLQICYGARSTKLLQLREVSGKILLMIGFIALKYNLKSYFNFNACSWSSSGNIIPNLKNIWL